jgi:hypothetical protein
MSMLKNKDIIKSILLLRPKLWKTIELQPVAFPRNGTDENSIIKTLKQTRIFLQAIN